MTEEAAEKVENQIKDDSVPATKKIDITDLVDRTTERIAFLKKKQEELQKQKAELEELDCQRKELNAGKREALNNLERAIAVLENEESEFQRKHSLVQTTKDEFKKIVKQVRSIREATWREENIKEELSQALAIVSKAKREFREAQGKIEALTSRGLEAGGKIHIPEMSSTELFPSKPSELLKGGLLFFLPAALLALLVAILIRFIFLLL